VGDNLNYQSLSHTLNSQKLGFLCDLIPLISPNLKRVCFSMDNPTVQRLPSKSSELNLAPNRSDEELARSRNIERLINVNHSRAPSRTIYFDRFIPSRTGSNFALLHLPPERPEDSVYSRLLRSVLFGPESGAVSPTTPENRSDWMNPPSRNIFRYQTETRRPFHSVSPLESYDAVAGVNHCPVMAPRKIPKSPYKVHSWFNLVICA